MAHRIDSTNKEVDKFGSGKHGFTEGTPGSVAPTETTEDWFDGVQEEICNVVEGYGITLVKNTRNQLLRAVQSAIGALGASNWTARSAAGGGTYFNSVEHDNSGLWCLVGQAGDIQTSPDGYAWTARTAAGAFAGIFYDVAHDHSGLWCAVGAGGEIQTSSDGITWTQRTAAGAYAGDFHGVFHDKSGLWVIVGNTAEIQTSPDGITWTQRTAGSGYVDNLIAVTHDESGLWVIAGYAKEIQTSPDGITWTQRNTGGTGGVDTFQGVGYDGSGLFAACNNTGDVWTSPDGTTWTQRAISGGPANAYAIRFDRGNGLRAWVISGSTSGTANPFAVSSDGITWKPVYQDTSALSTVSGLGVQRGRGLLAVGGTNIFGSLLTS